MNNLQQDTMLIMGFHAPKGIEYQLSLISSKERKVTIDTPVFSIVLKSLKNDGVWSPILMNYSTFTTVSDGGFIGMKLAQELNELISFSILVARFLESHSQWNI